MRNYITGVVIGLIAGCFITVNYASTHFYKEGQAVYYKLDKQLDGSTK